MKIINNIYIYILSNSEMNDLMMMGDVDDDDDDFGLWSLR